LGQGARCPTLDERLAPEAADVKLLLAALPAAPDVDQDWIVCCGETREVVDGRVSCPRAGGDPVAVEDCAACRFLTWRHDERDARPPCTIGN
jgi:hypothetical protein